MHMKGTRTVVVLAALAASMVCLAAEPAGGGNKPRAAVNLRAGPAQSQALFDEIAAADKALFGAVFDTCDVKALHELVADDFEFYHDKDGLSETSGAKFIDDIAKHCERIEKGVDFRARRELVEGSLGVYPLNNYGAVETGIHRFFALHRNKPEGLTETSRFTQLWKQEQGGWKLSRVIIYGHVLRDEPP